MGATTPTIPMTGTDGRGDLDTPQKERCGDLLETPSPELSAGVSGRLESGQHRDDQEKIGLRTLGDGPSAPGAAGEAAQAEAEAEREDEDKEVSPGVKGWLNLLGVGLECRVVLRYRADRSGCRGQYVVLYAPLVRLV